MFDIINLAGIRVCDSVHVSVALITLHMQQRII
jgi:hypothetical protein